MKLENVRIKAELIFIASLIVSGMFKTMTNTFISIISGILMIIAGILLLISKMKIKDLKDALNKSEVEK